MIILVNLHDNDFENNFSHIDPNQAMRILHGEYQGNILLALDVTHRAWTLVGKGWLVAPLQFPIIKQISHAIYLILAKYRQPISKFIYQHLGIGNNTCIQGVCYEKQDSNNHRSK